MAREQVSVPRQMENVQGRLFTTVRIITQIGTISTSAAGYIPLQKIETNSVATWSDFASIASRFSEYRVKALRVRWYPLVNNSPAATNTYTVVPPPSPIIGAVYNNASGYGSANTLLQGAENQLWEVGRKVDKSVDWSGNPDAKLWTETTTQIPFAQSFGIQLQDTAIGPASAVSTVYFRFIYQAEVEFRLSQ